MVGLDINSGMLAVARSLPPVAGVLIEWHEASVLGMPFSDGAFDVVLCQLGLQFFPDRPAALREMWRVLSPGGRLGLSVFSAIEHTPAANALANALERHLGPGASKTKRTEHSLADADELRNLVTGAGFRDATIRTTTQQIRFPSPREYARVQLAATPMAALASGMERERRDALVDAIADEVRAAVRGDAPKGDLIFPQEAHVLLARK